MNEIQELRRQFFQIYQFDVVADKTAPRAGQIACVKNTPDFGSSLVYLITDGVHTIRELYDVWKVTQVSPEVLQTGLLIEKAERIEADRLLGLRIDDIAEETTRALIFENHAELNEWMSANPPATLAPPNPAYTPADLKIGWLALFRSGETMGEPDMWWDGNEWLEKHVNIDLSGYRTAEDQDAIDGLFAPIHSPEFTGIPQVTFPDYTVPLQAAPVSEIENVMGVVWSILSGQRLIVERDLPSRPGAIFCSERDWRKRIKLERATV